MLTRTLIIGDIHGMYDELQRVLVHARYSESDRLVFIGDYIDRGMQSRKVLDCLLKLKENPANVFLRGNHEDMVLKLFQGETGYWYTWLEHGEGKACARSYGIDPDRFLFRGGQYVFSEGRREMPLSEKAETVSIITRLFPDEHIQFMKDTAITFETEDFFFSHAGIESGVALEDQTLFHDQFLIWGDEGFLADERDYGKTVVFGHYHWQEPFIGVRKVGIALQDAVSLFDLENLIIMDSNGKTTQYPG